MSRLITPQAFTRVSNLLKNTKGTIVTGGETDETTKFIAPTIVKDVKPDDSLLSEYVLNSCLIIFEPSIVFIREIFGPVLPIMPVSSIEEGLAYVNAQYVAHCSLL